MKQVDRQTDRSIGEDFHPWYYRESDFLPLCNRGGLVTALRHAKFGYELPIRPNGFAPKSGLLVAKSLERVPVANGIVFDIGTGETALLAVHSAALGARRVVAIDIDPIAAAWARKTVNQTIYHDRIEVHEESVALFSPGYEADIVVANPPQMPVMLNRSMHDDGGWSGRDTILEVLRFSEMNLKEGGTLLISMLDFLGVEESFSSGYEPLFDIMRGMSMTPYILDSIPKELRAGGHTHKNIDHIKSVYPDYLFRSNHLGNPVINIAMVCARKVSKSD